MFTSFSQLIVHTVLTCAKGHSAVPSLFSGSFASCNLSEYTSSDLVPLDMMWACTCAGKGDVVYVPKGTHTHKQTCKGVT